MIVEPLYLTVQALARQHSLRRLVPGDRARQLGALRALITRIEASGGPGGTLPAHSKHMFPPASRWSC